MIKMIARTKMIGGQHIRTGQVFLATEERAKYLERRRLAERLMTTKKRRPYKRKVENDTNDDSLNDS
jgi:hypothetical protein